MTPSSSNAPARPTVRFMLAHPAHWMAMGFGSGLAPWAPGTCGTLWAWLSYVVLAPWLSDAQWAALIAASLIIGWWACTVTARHLGVKDPSAIVWDEIVAFWLVLWMISPAHWMGQAGAFVLFRLFDAAKPGPVGWADRCFQLPPGSPPGAAQGWGILWDDLVAAGCTLLIVAFWRAGIS
ncbi:MAG: phosphatidylglycerophosphatase A [Burkholderiales bacterium]|jgi:phosphatidylglycerophosphatase A